MNIIATVSGAWNAFATKVGAFLPDLFAAIIILFVGWIGCNIARRIAVRALRVCRFELLAEKSGIDQALKRGGIQQNATEILGLLIFWFLFLIVIVATLDTLGLPGVSETMNTIFLYFPRVVAALVVLILGLYLANFIETLTRTSCANAGLHQAAAIGRVTYYATVIFVVAAILQILEIAGEIVLWAFVSVFGAICLALAIAFGLGGREVAARYLEKWFEQK
ncbi:MAG: hypothetical protein HYT78_08810 [Deltaproteobacteria bacterium]|nr:hypothetical protein [Deltaproteobacteria bacterium]